MNKHGEAYSHRRFCASHGWHGLLYPCDKYSKATLADIEEQSGRLVKNLSSKEWCDEQVSTGKVPPEGIAIFRIFAGLQ